MCHTKHTTKFDGQKGKDWGHRHEEFKVSFGKTIGYVRVSCLIRIPNLIVPPDSYEIYYFKSGTFTRQGDGGYLNVRSFCSWLSTHLAYCFIVGLLWTSQEQV